jgi:two-component system sensor histidine kinase KdpD
MRNFFPYLRAIVIVLICTLINFVLYPYLKESNLIMIYLLGVSIVALLSKRGPAVVASIVSIVMYDLFFIPDFFSLSVSDFQYVITLIIMLVVTQIICHLSIHIKRQIESVRKAQSEIEIERDRNILLTSISHDLRTPLTAIIGSASSMLELGDRLSANEHTELTKNIYDESVRLNSLVNNILQMIRLESGVIKISNQVHSLEEIIWVTLNKCKTRLAGKLVATHMKKATVLMSFDNILIGQVISNLIENAIKFTPAESPIDIFLEYQNNNAIVKIADRGPGLNADDFENIFNKFYRGQKPETSGIGLGLAICKAIIHIHQGKIWAEPRDSGGVVFCFSLPMVA